MFYCFMMTTEQDGDSNKSWTAVGSEVLDHLQQN